MDSYTQEGYDYPQADMAVAGDAYGYDQGYDAYAPQEGYGTDEFAVRLRDIEERQRLLKERTLLLGNNLLEIRQKMDEEMKAMRNQLTIMNQTVEKTNKFLEMASKEFANFARKDDLAILAKQAKMFQPLDFVKKAEFDLLKKRIK